MKILHPVQILLVVVASVFAAPSAWPATLISGQFFDADTNSTLPDKTGLTVGIAAGQNFTSNTKGISGVKLDFDSVPGGIDAGDFTLSHGNSDQTGGWESISVFDLAVDGNSVILTWEDPIVTNEWGEVTYLANQRMYFGNLIGDANLDRAVSPMDALIVINHINSAVANDAAVPYEAALDINADGLITANDALTIINRLNAQDPDLSIAGGPFTGEPTQFPSTPPNEAAFSYEMVSTDGNYTLAATPLTESSSSDPTQNGLFWQIEDVDAPKSFATARTAVAVDALGFAHIAYGGDHLYYAYCDGAGWHYEIADAAPDVGTHLSMALDSAGHAHISYFDARNEDLKYATNASGAWTAVTLDSDGLVGQYSAIAIDNSGFVHISYYYYGPATLRYATNAGGSWSTEDVHISSTGAFGSGNVGWFSDIAVDDAGTVHISYAGQEKGRLWYANNAFGGFFTQSIADLWPSSDGIGLTSSGQAVQTSIAVDPSQHIHIVYGYSATVPSNSVILKHISNQNVVDLFDPWDIETVDDMFTDVGKHNDLAVDSAGNLHVSYTTGNTPGDADSWNLRYATNADGTWAHTTVDNGSQGGAYTNTEVGLYAAIAVGADDAVHITYLNTTHYPFSACPDKGPNACPEIDLRDRLWYAKNAGTGWMFTEIDKTGRVGDTPALAVTPDGIVHITYHEELVDTLKYAAGIAGNWKVETAGDTGYAATADGNRAGAMVADTDGAVHIAFSNLMAYDGDGSLIGSELIYTHRPPAAGWQVAQILATQANPTYRGHVPSLAVDSTGVIHASFSGGSAILYANSASDWTPVSVSQGQSVGIYSDIAVDPQNRPHVVYVSSSGTLLHRVLDGGVWGSADPVDTNVSINQRPNIVVDAAGVIHVTYASGGGLTYASNDGSGWSPQVLSGGAGDMTLGADGTTLHLCYSSGGDLYYMTNASGDFVSDLVAADVSTGNDCAIAVDAWERIHIGYFNRSLYDLNYARAVAGVPNVGVQPIAHDYGGVDALSTVRKTFSIVNHGDAVLEIADIRIDDQGPIKHFSLDRNGGAQPCEGGAVLLMPAETCTVAVDFTPKTLGPLGAILLVDSNDPSTPALGIEISGTGNRLISTPSLGVSPGAYNFGQLDIGKTTPPLAFRLQNLGDETLDISSMGIDTPPLNFALNLGGADPCEAVPFSLAAGESCTVTVSFHPAVIGPIEDSLEIGTNDPNAPLAAIPLQGTGIPPLIVSAISVSPAALGFGNVNVGDQSATQTVTIQNTSGDELSLAALSTEPLNYPYSVYRIDAGAGATPCGSLPAVLASGEACTVGVTFRPIYAGFSNALLRIRPADTDDPGAQVALNGMGLSIAAPPQISLSPAAWAFDDVIYRWDFAAPSGTVPIDIENSGGAELIVTGVTLSDDENFFITFSPAASEIPCGSPPIRIPPGRRCTLEAAFLPKYADDYTSTMTVASNDPDNPTASVDLAGIALRRGDMDRNHIVNVADLVLVLKVLSGAPDDGKPLGLSINGDTTIGSEEALFISQYLAGVRENLSPQLSSLRIVPTMPYSAYDKAYPLVWPKGEFTNALSITATFSDGTVIQNYPSAAAWQSDSAAALISQRGLLVSGDVYVDTPATITASVGGVTTTLSVTIVAPAITRAIILSDNDGDLFHDGDFTVPNGATEQWRCFGEIANGWQFDLTRDALWSVDDETRVFVQNGEHAGRLTRMTSGATVISCEIDQNGVVVHADAVAN